jgi:hypothetical protein
MQWIHIYQSQPVSSGLSCSTSAYCLYFLFRVMADLSLFASSAAEYLPAAVRQITQNVHYPPFLRSC